MDLELSDLIGPEWNDQQHQAGQGDDDRDEDKRDGKDSGHASRVQPRHRWLNQKGDRRPENESPKEVPE